MKSSLNLKASSKLNKDQNKKLRIVLNCLFQANDSFAFRQPVDWKGMGLTDYLNIVKHPMDLSTVTKKMNEQRYNYVEEVIDDLQLIWDDCKVYNPPNSWIYAVTEKLERSFRKMVRNYFPDLQVALPPKAADQGQMGGNMLDDEGEDITYEQKLKLSEELSFLSSEHLARAIQQVVNKCPSAFRQTGQGRGQILVDNMDLIFFNQLSVMIRNMLNNTMQLQQPKVKRGRGRPPVNSK